MNFLRHSVVIGLTATTVRQSCFSTKLFVLAYDTAVKNRHSNLAIDAEFEVRLSTYFVG